LRAEALFEHNENCKLELYRVNVAQIGQRLAWHEDDFKSTSRGRSHDEASRYPGGDGTASTPAVVAMVVGIRHQAKVA
jgi:hypothetical protein